MMLVVRMTRRMATQPGWGGRLKSKPTRRSPQDGLRRVGFFVASRAGLSDWRNICSNSSGGDHLVGDLKVVCIWLMLPPWHTTWSNFKEEIMATTTSPMKHLEDNFKGKPQEMQDMAKPLGDKAKGIASNILDKTTDFASNIVDTTKDTASSLSHKAQDATSAVGKGMEALASTVRHNLPQNGPVGAAAASLASGLESGGQYLEREGFQGMGKDMMNLIRRNPLPALLVGIGLGYIIARATARD